MRGLKSMNHVELCPAPCCPGYKEKVAFPPNLSPVVWCQRDEVRMSKMAAMLPRQADPACCKPNRLLLNRIDEFAVAKHFRKPVLGECFIVMG